MTARQLRALRTALGLSQAELAEFLAVSMATMHRWESGRQVRPHGLALSVLVVLQESANTASNVAHLGVNIRTWSLQGSTYALKRLLLHAGGPR